MLFIGFDCSELYISKTSLQTLPFEDFVPIIKEKYLVPPSDIPITTYYDISQPKWKTAVAWYNIQLGLDEIFKDKVE